MWILFIDEILRSQTVIERIITQYRSSQSSINESNVLESQTQWYDSKLKNEIEKSRRLVEIDECFEWKISYFDF